MVGENKFAKVEIQGAKEVEVQSPEEFLKLNQIAAENRTTVSTFKNDTSSRSHAVCRIRVKNTHLLSIEDGEFFLIDLAGSERGTVTENRGIRLREGAKINTSLLALANCINALGDKSKKGDEAWCF